MSFYRLFLMVFILAQCLTGCNNETTSEIGDVLVEDSTKTTISTAKESKEGEPENALTAFFSVEFPSIYEKPAHFLFNDDDKDITYVINSMDDFYTVYYGDREVPNIDLQNNTLIIGKEMIPVPCWSIKQKVLEQKADGYQLTLYLENLPKDRGYFTVVSPLFYWGLFPKMTNNRISVDFIYVD